MGAYSTRYITKKEALSGIMERLLEATNEELADTLFALTRDHVLDNYIVVDTEAEIHAVYCCSECGCFTSPMYSEDCAVVKGEIGQYQAHEHSDACYDKKYRESWEKGR